MRYFEVHYEAPGGAQYYRQGGQENLGSTLGYQRAESLYEDDRGVTITFDQGATIQIPRHRLIMVVKGSA
jgi:hypothetical protein